ncbi:TPA: hypothetical protein ACPYU1_001289, partial [Raoultella planticola]
ARHQIKQKAQSKDWAFCFSAVRIVSLNISSSSANGVLMRAWLLFCETGNHLLNKKGPVYRPGPFFCCCLPATVSAA